MLERLYNIRFELFLMTQVAILFGSLVVPSGVFDKVVAPLLIMINLLVGIILVSKRPFWVWVVVILLFVSTGMLGLTSVMGIESENYNIVRVVCYYIFYTIVTFEVIRQVWYADEVNRVMIIGLISGYISLGLIGCFIFTMIEWIHPGSFQGEVITLAISEGRNLTEPLMYFSYVTLMTIGYGDILPVTPTAQKAAILVGLVGQIYLVIITAVVVGKYISNSHTNPKE